MDKKIELKPLAEFNDRNKQTIFSLMIYDVMSKIETRFKDWVEGVFVEKIVNEETYTRNFLNNTDYILTEAIWLLEHAESLGYDMSDNRSHVEGIYKMYTESEFGYRYLYYLPHYDAKNHKYLTEDETKAREKKSNETMMKLIDDMKSEDKKDFLK